MLETLPLTTTRSPDEVSRAWRILDALYLADPTNLRVAGARAAAEWTLGHTNVAPISGETVLAEGRALSKEPHYSAMVELGIRPGDPAFARGAGVWLFWWIGLQPLPAWMHGLAAA